MICNEALIDWITITSFQMRHRVEFEEMIGKTQEWLGGHESTEGNHDRYTGEWVKDEHYGTLFVGIGMQKRDGKNQEHYIIRASGEIADFVAKRLREVAWRGAKCTRIDVQMTMVEPHKMRLINHVRYVDPRKYRHVSSAGKSGNLCTLYRGSRTSQRFHRCYEKENDGGLRFIRFETEFKGELAKEMYIKLGASTDWEGLLTSVLAYELQHYDVPSVSVAFPVLDTAQRMRVKSVKYRNPSRFPYVMNVVLPQLKRYLATNGDDEDVVIMSLEALIDTYKKRGID